MNIKSSQKRSITLQKIIKNPQMKSLDRILRLLRMGEALQRVEIMAAQLLTLFRMRADLMSCSIRILEYLISDWRMN